MDEKITAWVTPCSRAFVVIKTKGSFSKVWPDLFTYGFGGSASGVNLHLTEQSALERSEMMRAKKVVSMEKQLAKMRALKIQVIDQTK